MRALFVFATTLVLATAACSPSDPCVPGTTRCSGSTVEVCDYQQSWTYQESCDTLGGPNAGAFACRAYERDGGDTAYACVPVQPDGAPR